MKHGRYMPWKKPEGKEFLDLWQKIESRTMLDIDRGWELWSLARQSAKPECSMLEVGCRKGGSGAIIAKASQSMVYLADTFTGVAKAGKFDPYYKGGEHKSSVSDVLETMEIAEVRAGRVKILEGIFPEATEDMIPGKTIFSMVHIDVDTYESAKGVLEWLGYGGWPGTGRCCEGCVIVFDDYGFDRTCGVTKFVNEIKDGESIRFVYNSNGQGVVIVI